MTVIVIPTDLNFSTDSFDLPCHRVDPELFFSDQPTVIEAAKQLCHQCPLRSSCLSGALERQEPHGVWGGELFASGVVIARKRPRGRPRKNPLDGPLPSLTSLPPSPFRAQGERPELASAG